MVICTANKHIKRDNACNQCVSNMQFLDFPFLLMEMRKLTALTKGSKASSTRYDKVVPESIIVPRLFVVANFAGSIGNNCP